MTDRERVAKLMASFRPGRGIPNEHDRDRADRILALLDTEGTDPMAGKMELKDIMDRAQRQQEDMQVLAQGFEAGFFAGQKADPTGPLTQRMIEAAVQAWADPTAHPPLQSRDEGESKAGDEEGDHDGGVNRSPHPGPDETVQGVPTRDSAGSVPANSSYPGVAQSEPGEDHQPWCDSHGLALCSGCSVKSGWEYSPATGELTTCLDGKPHHWPQKPCNCGPNDQRRGDRRLRTGAGQ